MPHNLDVALLRTFVVTADRASMTAAGNTLHLTQGAVSQQIKRLEDLFRIKLFDRDRRGLRLTRPGEHLLAKARHLLSMNDEIYADMVTGSVEGPVRFGAPYDLVGTCLPPILKSYADTYPQAEVSITCAASPDLLVALAKGELDLAVIEEPLGASAGECLSVQRLVWVGARGGGAHRKDPLPVSMVAETCAFRPAVLDALRDSGRTWRTVFESGSLEATTATVQADLAVTAWLAFTVPSGLDILSTENGLPPLPPFAINLHVPRDCQPATVALSRHVRHALARQVLAA